MVLERVILFVALLGADQPSYAQPSGADQSRESENNDNTPGGNALVMVDPTTLLPGTAMDVVLNSTTGQVLAQTTPTTSSDPTFQQNLFSTPKQSTTSQKNLANRRKSNIDEGPQAKIMRQQVTAVEEQVETFKRIEIVLGEIRDIEREKLAVMKGESSDA